MSETVVIGGGVAGLASAILAADQGHHVTLLEMNPQVGGRAGLHNEAGFAFDTGPSWYLMPQVFERFFASVGEDITEHLDLVTLDPGYRVSDRGLLDSAPQLTVDVPHGYSGVRALFERLEPGVGPALDAYVESARDTHDLALDHFLYTRFSSLREFVSPQVARQAHRLPRFLASPLDSMVSRTVTHPLLRQILGYPAVFLGTEPRRAPSLFHLMSYLDLVDGVRYPRGGMYEIVRALTRLARARGVDIRTSTQVVSLQLEGRTIAEVVARTVPETTSGGSELEVFPAANVIAACDLHHLDTVLLPPGRRTRSVRGWGKRDPGIGAVTLLLGVDSKLDALEHHNLFFTRDWDANFDQIFVDGRLPEPASAYVCAPSRTDDTVAPPGCENLFVLIPAPASAHLTGARLGDYASRVIESLGERVGVPDLESHLLVKKVAGPGDFTTQFNAWRGTALGPANTLFQSAMFRYPVRAPHVDNLVHAGAFAAPGVGLPMCLISAHNAVEAL